MTLYDKNINTLAQYYPGMDENIKEAKEQGKDTTKIEEFLSEDNERILKITKEGHSCFLAGKGVQSVRHMSGFWNRKILRSAIPIYLWVLGILDIYGNSLNT